MRTNATNATTAVSFSGNLTGDVSGTQGATTVTKLQGRTVANATPLNGQVLKFNSTTNQWEPDTDNTSTGGGGTITGVTPGTGLTGGGASGNVTLGLANGGVNTAQLADNGVTDAKVVSISGAKITGTVRQCNQCSECDECGECHQRNKCYECHQRHQCDNRNQFLWRTRWGCHGESRHDDGGKAA